VPLRRLGLKKTKIYAIWIGDKVFIPITVSILVYLWMILNTWNNIYSNFLNGIGKIKLQFYLGISAAIINIPLSIILGKKIGIEGVLLANVFLGIIGAIIYPIQYKKLIKNKAKGIWNG
jgi:Na+-driven multidrug efflux pump